MLFSIFVAPEGNTDMTNICSEERRRLFRLASEKNRAGFIVFIFALIFSVLPTAVSGQEEDRSAEIDQKLELLYGRVVKNQNALDGLSNGIRSTKTRHLKMLLPSERSPICLQRRARSWMVIKRL